VYGAACRLPHKGIRLARNRPGGSTTTFQLERATQRQLRQAVHRPPDPWSDPCSKLPIPNVGVTEPIETQKEYDANVGPDRIRRRSVFDNFDQEKNDIHP
jgi:hypothetical protein